MITIINYEKVDKGLMTCVIDIQLDIDILHMNPPLVSSMIIRRIAVMEKNGRKWFSFPSFPVYGPDNQKKYTPFIAFKDKFDHDSFSKQLALELKDYLDKNKEPTQKNASVFQKNR